MALSLGPGILVDPVVQPGVDSRSVYLPARTSWIDLWTGKQILGGQAMQASARLYRIPLYVRARCIIPLASVKEDAMEPERDIELRIYQDSNRSFDLHEDEGNGYGYEKGEFSIAPIEWDEASRTLTIGKQAGTFKGMEKSKRFHVVWVCDGKGDGMQPVTDSDADVTYTRSTVQVYAPAGL